MKKQIRLGQFILVVITMSLLIHACSTNSPVSIGSTPTPTATLGSSGNSVATTPIAELLSSATAPVQKVDVCSFFTSADAEPLVGTALIDITPGNDFDEITGGPLDYCTYKGDDVALVLSIVKSSAPKGSDEWQNQLIEMSKASDPEAAVTPVSPDPEAAATPTSDIGELSYWVITESSVGLSTAKYPYIFIIAVGGNIGYSEDYKDDLIALRQKVMDQLP